VVSFDATLLDIMLTVTIGEMLNNFCTCGTERTLMASKCQFKEKQLQGKFKQQVKHLMGRITQFFLIGEIN